MMYCYFSLSFKLIRYIFCVTNVSLSRVGDHRDNHIHTFQLHPPRSISCKVGLMRCKLSIRELREALKLHLNKETVGTEAL